MDIHIENCNSGNIGNKGRLARWGVNIETTCALCQQGTETIQHSFFECEMTGTIWQQLLHWQGIQRKKLKWQEELAWIQRAAKGRSGGATLCRMTLAAVVYYIWQERNNTIFKQKIRTSASIVRMIIQEIHIRATMFPRLERTITKENWHLDTMEQ
ncbi:uncharacterized protein [Nicotiana sylvestris]|uniref:Uncharacterized protein LOC104211132 n=1 Tax=Nicotiana sylvestris TaxID=4096 RepID=A0A1U7V9E1_NICSY|nr:PREDICTED: uncharacterized protein LOC104211132 [Nicotiana sylvestris]